MTDALFGSRTFAAFLIASVILAVTPGPGVLYIVTRTLDQGSRAGLASVAGIALGNLANAAAASVGLAAVLAASAGAFMVLKLAGAAYLIYLGVRTLRAAAKVDTGTAQPVAATRGRLFRDGFMVALLNPKTALFFAALLPQFINPGGTALAESLTLSCVFVLIAVCTDTGYALSAAAVTAAFRRRSSRPFGRYVTGVTFIGLGVYAAVSGPKSDLISR